MPMRLCREFTEPISDHYYDLKTDVWLFADVEGYTDFVADLKRARSVKEPIHVEAIPPDSPGMRCAIMPAATFPTRSAALKILERVVFWRGERAMQLVLCGNRRAYSRLIDLVQRAIAAAGNPVDHWHVDDNYDDNWVIKRSVSLNIRGAVKGWTDDDLMYYAADIRAGGSRRMPENLSWLDASPENAYDYLPLEICKLVADQVAHRSTRGQLC